MKNFEIKAYINQIFFQEQGEEGEEDAGSVESLHWDPVDGLHAEKQLPVQKLKAMFDRKSSLK